MNEQRDNDRESRPCNCTAVSNAFLPRHELGDARFAGANSNIRSPKHFVCAGADEDALPPATTASASVPPNATDWKKAFQQQDADAFAKTLAGDVVLEASVLYRPITGRDAVKLVMASASKIYEKLKFTNEVTDGPRRYLAWQARAFGGVKMSGVTIVTRNDAGAITHLAIHHRPLGALLRFSAELSHRLRGVIDRSHFLAASDLHNDGKQSS